MLVLLIWLILLSILTLSGIGLWVVIAKVVRFLFPREKQAHEDDLTVTERQIIRFYSEGKLDEQTYQTLIDRIRAERDGGATPAAEKPAEQPAEKPVTPPIITPTPVATGSFIATDDEIIIEPAPSFMDASEPAPPPQPTPPPPPPPRRSFSEVLNSFMEESNIRWGEIIGGLLIIGCSTALVVSLWAQISQIPVLKFLIFTTVTAILFGIGLYTEHRWKLPTTSRGILTIATLLVPLNFLAIAAVSASNTTGALVIGSELLAPAIFLCLVYFAGRVIAPGCAQILAAGVLGSSVGQLLVRHFAAIDSSPALLIFLGAFPVTSYVVTVALALRIVLEDREIDETETTTVFTILGTMSFAALLPFGLLLYRSGPLGMSMMYLAPLVTLWGLPMLATGTILWRRISNRELVASRTAGTALGLLGVVIVLAGMILAWPNPASIVPAALLNFAIFTALAVALELPVAHLIATGCFALAYLVLCHVLAGDITWQNLRVMSLLKVSLSVGSGQMLVGAFAMFLIGSEWLSRRARERDSFYYLVASCFTAVISLMLVAVLGLLDEYHPLWIIYGLYSLGAFWIAWRYQRSQFTWIANGLLLFSLAHSFAYVFSFAFPWQTALFALATFCAMAAIVTARYERARILSTPLNYSALISIGLGVVCLFQANQWEVTWMQAQRVYWIAGTLGLLLWLNRRRILLNALQISLIAALVLTVKAALQQYQWYAYLPGAFLHPAALQIQGTVLALFCLAWLVLRLLARRAPADRHSWLTDARRLFQTDWAPDRLLAQLLLAAFVFLVVYGTLSGIGQELQALGSGYAFDIADFPHQEALGVGSWVLLGLLLLITLGSFWERRDRVHLLGALVILLTIVPLLAGRFEAQLATATAWRWLAAIFLLFGSLVLWYRRPIAQRLASLGWPNIDDLNAFSTQARTVLLGLTFTPLIVLTIYPALRSIAYLPVQTPVRGVFSLFDNGLSYGFPLVVVALVLIGFALRERMPRFAFYAGLLFNLTITLAFLLAHVGGPMDRLVLVRLAQLNATTFAIYLLPWLSTRARWQNGVGEKDVQFVNYLLKLQLALAVVTSGVLLAPFALNLIFATSAVGPATAATGGFLGWLSLFAIVTATVWLAKSRTIQLSAAALCALLLSVNGLLAFNAAGITGWLGVHTLTVGLAVIAWLMFFAAELKQDLFELNEKWPAQCRTLAAIVGGVAVFLSVRSFADWERSYWWSIAPLLAITALAAALNWKTLRRRYIYAAGALLHVTLFLWWVRTADNNPVSLDYVLANVIAGSLSGVLWLAFELRSRRLSGREPAFPLAFHQLAAIFWLGTLMLVVIANNSLYEASVRLLQAPLLTWLAFVSLLAFMASCLWDKRARYAVAGLYTLGLVGCAIALLQLGLSTTRFVWATPVVLSVYSLVVAMLWHSRQTIIEFAKRFGIPERIDRDTTELAWLSAFSILAVATVGGLAYWINVRFLDFELRLSAAVAFAAQGVTFALIARGVVAERWRRAAIGTLVAGAILVGWSWLTPGVDATWLNRSVILMLEAFGLTAIYGLLLDKANAQWPHWTSAARACVPWLLGAGVVALFFSLATEIDYQRDFGVVRINSFSLITIGLTLVAAIVTSVLFALSPTHDPLNLSERGRMRYVYVAEVMLALLFLHVRLTMPWLFTGFLERYWPLVVMLIAYFGVVTSEALRRRKLFVLAQPLERTGAFLPLLPVIGFWAASSDVDFSLLLFAVGGLYGLLSILRKSFAFGLLAALAGNGGLWYIWHRTSDYQFLQHPQLWLIPVALSVLAGAYMNEDKLSEEQFTGIRYLSLVTIYVSSTADIFINGAANSPWLPLILGSFSLAGVFAGISLRIRGLLLLGSIFLLLSIVTMIWYASVNLGWTWLWYVAGIVTGATIIFMFAVFEKKRGEVLRVVEGLKDWDR